MVYSYEHVENWIHLWFYNLSHYTAYNMYMFIYIYMHLSHNYKYYKY